MEIKLRLKRTEVISYVKSLPLTDQLFILDTALTNTLAKTSDSKAEALAIAMGLRAEYADMYSNYVCDLELSKKRRFTKHEDK